MTTRTTNTAGRSRRALRGTLTAGLLVGLVGGAALSGAAPAAAATTVPAGWENAALGLPAAQRLSQGEGVTVAVIDSGVDPDHPSVKGHVTTGPDFMKDGKSPSDDDWGLHGTAMASAILKVAPRAKILSIRSIDDSAEEDTGEVTFRHDGDPIAKGIDYAVEHGADVISLSLGNKFADYQRPVANALGYAASSGITTVAAAGNAGDESNDGNFPAGYASAIAVAATRPGGGRAALSNVKTYNAVAAPGVGVTLAERSGGYAKRDGTSVSTALTAGVLALMYAEYPDLTPAQARSALTRTASHPGRHSALDGYGPVNAAAAVRAADTRQEVEAEPVEYRGEKHFETPSGVSKTAHAPMEQPLWLGGLGAAVLGLLLLAGGVVLLRRPRART
ncbi:S8 family peptidase [Streptomyces xanthii]|uniref:S8 family peptidase n=1 Tax=Streptomyces xanthii TaxID=2768069 RepID=UPI001CB77BE0|nr:S8 family serine peptidase [Streptomyces xanthii]